MNFKEILENEAVGCRGVGRGKSKPFLVRWSDVTCEPKLIHMLYPKPARTRLTTHGQMICRAHIPQLHTERGREQE